MKKLKYWLTRNSVSTTSCPARRLALPSKNWRSSHSSESRVVGSASMVEYRVGTKGAFKLATGTSAWTINVSKLKVGKNVITIQAMGVGGTTSTKVTVTVKKK